jgi:hypothetical protein
MKKIFFIVLAFVFSGCDSSNVTPDNYKKFLNELSEITIVKKDNLETWNRLQVPNVSGRKKIAVKDSNFIALVNPISEKKALSTTGSTVLNSDNGLNWKGIDVTLEGIYNAIISTPNYFYAVGTSLSDRQKGSVIRSIDGKTWEEVFISNHPLNDVVYTDGMLIAVGLNGLIIDSNDGKNWKTQSIGNNISLYCIVDGEASHTFVEGDPGVVYMSDDNKKWNKLETKVPTVGLRNGLYLNGKYLLFSNDYTLIYSHNKIDAIKKKSASNEIIYQNNFMDIMNSKALISNDGKNWEEKANVQDINSSITDIELKNFLIYGSSIIFINN